MEDWTIVAVGAVLGSSQILAVWAAIRARRAAEGLEQRTAALGDAIALLTETSEAGFHAVATELIRVASGRPVRAASTRAATTRVRAAARRGASPSEIAAEEQMSEGEVRLRLHLGDPPAASIAHDRAPRTRQARPQGAGRVGAEE